MKSLINKLGFEEFKISYAHVFWSMAIVCQVLFWYLAVPGPQLSSDYSPSLTSGIHACVWTALFLIAVPIAFCVLSRSSLRHLGLGLGDWKFGLLAIAILSPVVSILVVLGAADPAIQDFYPMVGDQFPNQGDWVIWFCWYGVFYIGFELFYRGFLLQYPEDWPMATRGTIAVACCTLVHVGKPLIETLASIPGSILFVLLTVRTKSIWYGVLLHWLIGIVNDLGVLWRA